MVLRGVRVRARAESLNERRGEALADDDDDDDDEMGCGDMW